MKKVFLMALAAAAIFSSCSKDEGGNSPSTGFEGETAYLALKLPVQPRSNTEDPGAPEESTMGKATVLLFDADNKCLGTVEFNAFSVNPANESKEVPAKTAKVFVIVNKAANWDLSAVVNMSWDAINTFQNVTVNDIATNDAFMMTNAGDNTKGALVEVTVYATAAEAKANPNTIKVDRVASKILVKSTNPTATGATFSFLGWDLNTVNKSTRLYAERITYANASTTDVPAIYRRDKNYLKGENTNLTEFNWLSNGTSSSTMSKVEKANNGVTYCIENTMDADAQLWGYTTKVVVKGKYTPNTDATGTALTAGETYFSWNSNYYSVTNLKAEYKKVGRDNLKTDLIIFLSAADDVFNALSAEDKKVEGTIDAAIDGLNDYSGIKAKYKAVKYYHNSVCYYDALIRHDNNVTTPMALGRYGVVRNNSYAINVSAVKSPGTPWIPDPTDPTDPTKPGDPDDEIPANLSIVVEVNPWTLWAHDVELGN